MPNYLSYGHTSINRSGKEGKDHEEMVTDFEKDMRRMEIRDCIRKAQERDEWRDIVEKIKVHRGR